MHTHLHTYIHVYLHHTHICHITHDVHPPTHTPYAHVHTHTTLHLRVQTNPISLAVMLADCRLIEQYIQGASHPIENVLRELLSPTRQHPSPADHEVIGYIEAALQSKALSVFDATWKFGKACCKSILKFNVYGICTGLFLSDPLYL